MAHKFYQYPGTRIFVLDDYHPYRSEVVKYLDLIGTTYSGKVLLHFCSLHSDREIDILPFKPTPGNRVNADVIAPSVDGYAFGQPMRDDHGALTGPPDASGSPTLGPLGTGIGEKRTFVRYHPANQRQYVANMHWIPPGSGPGEMLCHELVHAMRQMLGLFLRTPVPDNPDMENFEEFCAIAAGNNLYRSERGFRTLRDSHMGFHALKNLNDPDNYYDYYKDEFKAWFDNQRSYCMNLARSQAPFNPFKSAAIDLHLMPKPQFKMALPSP